MDIISIRRPIGLLETVLQVRSPNWWILFRPRANTKALEVWTPLSPPQQTEYSIFAPWLILLLIFTECQVPGIQWRRDNWSIRENHLHTWLVQMAIPEYTDRTSIDHSNLHVEGVWPFHEILHVDHRVSVSECIWIVK